MMKKGWIHIIFWVAISEAVGLVAGFLIRNGVQIYGQTATLPPLAPPAWVFPVVWTILYAIMGVGAGLVSHQKDSAARDRALNLMVAQLVVNFFWPLLFFNAQVYGFALLWLFLLLTLVLWMMREFRKVSLLAARLQIPYLIWLTFAAYLNAAVWYMNQ